MEIIAFLLLWVLCGIVGAVIIHLSMIYDREKEQTKNEAFKLYGWSILGGVITLMSSLVMLLIRFMSSILK